MENKELVFIPMPAMGHLVSMLETAKLLIKRDQRLSVTVLIFKLPFDTGIDTYIQSLSSSSSATRLKLVNLPDPQKPPSEEEEEIPKSFLSDLIDSHKPHVRNAVRDIGESRVAAFVVDMVCYNMIDVAGEFGLPTYTFFPSSAGFLGLLFHLQILMDHHNRDVSDYRDWDLDKELSVPSYINPVPAKVLPLAMLDKQVGGVSPVVTLARRLRETKGILINTFPELESHALHYLLSGNNPPVYPIGPVLLVPERSFNGVHGYNEGIMIWLENQRPSSVLFLCFGSAGSFNEAQIKEIAHALENSGHRFLWSLRRPPPEEKKIELPTDYTDPLEVLPEGFLERTVNTGRLIGWAPQVAVLSHPSAGGFISHCGWNSVLESLWFGVPMAAWPNYAEQQINAFQMVRDLGLAVDIKMEYRKENPVLVKAEEIESGIRRLMTEESGGGIREKLREMKEKGRMAVAEGRSSYTALAQFIENVLRPSQMIDRKW